MSENTIPYKKTSEQGKMAGETCLCDDYSHSHNPSGICGKVHGMMPSVVNMWHRCTGCGKENPLYVEMCECGMPTKMKTPGRESSQFEKRLEYDKLMEGFLNALLAKVGQSPEIAQIIREAGRLTLAEHNKCSGNQWLSQDT